MAKLTFLGMGLIGSGLAEAALVRGDDVTVWNRSPGKTTPLAEKGAHVAASAADAVKGAEHVHLAVSDDAAVEAVLEACGDLTGTVVVDHSTTGPKPTAARAERLAAAGVAYLHAPVFMSPAMCREAGGMMLAAGPDDVYHRVADALATMTGRVLYLGEDRGKAAAFKLFGNAMIFTVTAGLSDVFEMARSLGIDAEDARGLFDTFQPGNTLVYRGKKMAAGDFTPSFELTMARKDARLMLETVSDLQALTVLPALVRRMDDLIGKGHGAEDLGVLAIDAVTKAS